LKIKELAYFCAALFIVSQSASAFVVSVDECNRFASDTVYEFVLNDYLPSPDYSVQVDNYIPSPDVKIQVVSNPREADLIVAQDLDRANMRVCHAGDYSPRSDVKKIMVADYIPSPDIKIQISEREYNPDYKIFFQTHRMSLEEAVAIFFTTWNTK